MIYNNTFSGVYVASFDTEFYFSTPPRKNASSKSSMYLKCKIDLFLQKHRIGNVCIESLPRKQKKNTQQLKLPRV